MPRFMIMYFYTKQNNKTDFWKDLISATFFQTENNFFLNNFNMKILQQKKI